MKLLPWLLGAIMLPLCAHAANPTPGLESLFTTKRPSATTDAKAPPASAPVPAAPASDADPAKAAALLNLVQQAEGNIARHVPVPPHDLTVAPGTTTAIAIALGTLNRLRTPFEDPVVTHGQSIAVQRQGSVLFLSSNDPTPSALFISPRGNPDQAIVLSVTPAPGLDPVTVDLHLDGYEPSVIAAAPKDAASFEASQPYVDMLKDIFRDLARGQIPPGFGYTQVDGTTPWMPACAMPGVRITARQLLDGGNLIALVARAVNTSIDTTEIDESACASAGVLAVAAWPTVRLDPGQETELYVVVRRPDPSTEARHRPTALDSGEPHGSR